MCSGLLRTLRELITGWICLSPLDSPSPPTFNLSQHQGLFQWVSSSHQVAKRLELPVNIQDWSPLGWTGWISLLFKGLSRVFSNTTVQKHQFFGPQPSLWTNSHIQKNHSFGYRDLLSAKRCLCFLTCCSCEYMFVIVFLPRSKHLLISWLQSPSAVILEPQTKVCYCFHCFPIY